MRNSLWVIALLVMLCGNARADLQDRLAVYLPLSENFQDVSGNHMQVKAWGQMRVEDGAAFFPGGPDDWLEMTNIRFDKRPFAIAMWVKVTGREPMYTLFQQEDSNGYNHWLHVMLRGGLQPYLGFYINDAISPEPISAGAWTHLVFQYSGGEQQIWINGRLLCARTSIAYEGVNGIPSIGRSTSWNNVPSRNFTGFMREFRVYQRALDYKEIAALSGIRGNALPAGIQPPRPDPALSQALAADVGIPYLKIQGNHLAITGESMQVYEVRATSNLNLPFEIIGYATNLSGRVEFIDSGAGQNESRFYVLKLRR